MKIRAERILVGTGCQLKYESSTGREEQNLICHDRLSLSNEAQCCKFSSVDKSISR